MQDENKGSDSASHDWGTNKGEETVSKHGKEAGRFDNETTEGESPSGGRTARDSTSVNPKGQEAIDPRMPKMPPP